MSPDTAPSSESQRPSDGHDEQDRRRDLQGYEERPGRSGPDVGDATGGQGAEFAGDAITDQPIDDDPDAAASWLAAHGKSSDPGGDPQAR